MHPDIVTFNCFVPLHLLREERKRYKPIILLHLQDLIWDRTLFLFLSPFLLFLVFDATVAIFLPERHGVVGSTYASCLGGTSFESRSRDFVSNELDD